jgi:signal transduction histidine kinase
MPEFIAPLLPEYSIHIPQSAVSLVGWLVWLVVLVVLTIRNRGRRFDLNRASLAWLALLSVLLLIFTPFLGVPIQIEGSEGAPHLMFLAALPWMAAGGLLGMVPSVLLAGLSGVLLAYFDTHAIFTPLLFMSLAVVFNLAIRQKHQTFIYRLLRIPPIAALAAVALLFPLTFLALFLNAEGDLAASMVATLTQFLPVYLSLGGMALLGGLGCLGLQLLTGDRWAGSDESDTESQSAQNLGLRYVLIALPLAIVLLAATVAGQWKSAREFARRSVVTEMTSTAQSLAGGMDEFLASGESAVQQAADGMDAAQWNTENAQLALEEQWAALSNFDRIALTGPDGALLVAYPLLTGDEVFPSAGEQMALDQVLAGIAVQPVGNGSGLSFFAPAIGQEGQVLGVLWGRMELDTAAAFQDNLLGTEALIAAGGDIQLMDAAGQIVYSSDSAVQSTVYSGATFQSATYFETTDAAGAHHQEYFQPLENYGWSVIASIPNHLIQLQAVQEVTPLILAGFALIVLEAGIAVLMFSKLSKDAQELAGEAAKVTLGDLSLPDPKYRYSAGLKPLAERFMQMTASVKTRLQSQSDLLNVSERITGQLKLKDSLQVILVAALEHGISSARIILLNEAQPSSQVSPDQKFGMGKDARMLAPLDEDILTVTRVRGQWIMRGTQIGRNFHLAKGMTSPVLLVSLPLRWKNKLLGTLWLASDRQPDLGEEELTYFVDLSQKAATAIVNHKAFDESLTQRKQLEAVLTALDDAILVTDSNGLVTYANPAAAQLPELAEEPAAGIPLARMLGEGTFSTVDETPFGGTLTREVHIPDGKSYLLLAEPLKVDERTLGMIYIFKDVTAFRAQDATKTEFVTTVSHELRSPLTLMQGYARILLAGSLNDQQQIYVNNINTGVEEMRSLVQNLLDLGRLDSNDALEIREVAVDEVVRRAVELMDSQVKQKNIDLEVSLPEEPLLLQADAAFLVQALKNLVDNAIKYSSNKGRINLKVQRQGESAVMMVEDFGPGIAPLDQRKIFKRFYHSESQVGAGERSGSGLGLAIVKSIAERHGGKVWFESKLGRGSSFYLQIPLNPAKKAD